MAPSSLSSLYLSHHHQANPFPFLIPKPTFPRLPPCPQNLAFSSKPFTQTRNQDQSQNQDQTLKLNSPQPDKKSFTIATGERFLGFALRLIKGSNNRKAVSGGSETDFLRDGPNVASVNGSGRGARYDTKERIGIVTEDEIEPNVIWEQRIKDVETEQKRRVVTSLGFSFSAAGLLFPRHLGVAQCLIDKGYIKETTPLAGSSAGVVVCAAIASGVSMEEALMATKVLANDCRRRGTAFRLGQFIGGKQLHILLLHGKSLELKLIVKSE